MRAATATADRSAFSTENPVAEGLAEILAGVMNVDRVPTDRHFFDELGADSLVMAHFCARVRKRGDLPSISMKDVYAHPTISRLAAALADSVPAAGRPAPPPPAALPTPASAREHLLCGVLQASFYFAYVYLGVLAATAGYQWIVAGSEGAASYPRWILFGSAAFVVVCAVPVAAKWLLIGRWRPRQIRLWSLDYVRFWVVKTLISSSPGLHLFVGSPLYGLYLRALGAKIGPRVVILSRRIPVCTDLLTIGAGSVIRREASFLCYRAEAGRIEIGPVTIGRDVHVGESSVLDIDTAIGDGAQLGHTSALLRGQAVPAGERWHGSPAQRTETDYARVAPADCGRLRRSVYAALVLAGVLILWAPLLQGGLGLLFLQVAALVEALDPGVQSGDGELTVHGLLLEAFVFSGVFFFGALLLGIAAAGAVPRLLSGFLEADKTYPLYGFHYAVHRIVAGLGRLRFMTLLFGDSSYIVHFLGWVGFRLQPVVQTGSNFGSEVTTTTPWLSSVGSGTMVADGLSMINDELSSSSFRVSQAAIGARNFIGNYVTYPAGGRTGDNCLLAIKVMVPLDGEVRRDVGLLGSPPFEIPRSVERDSRYDHLRSGEALRRGLAAKNRFNLRTIAIFLLTRWLGIFLIALIDVAAYRFFYDVWGHALMAGLFALSAVVAAVYFALMERCVEAIGPPPPPICSIYDPQFWWVERLWKLHPIRFFHIFDGTPFKSVIWRLMGVRIGKRVFDDGIHISEPLLTSIGDDCVLNSQSKIQCDSQEDGTYKSGPTALGKGCTVGVAAFVHYGVVMNDGAALAADAFLMKGEELPAHAQWAGNPAREI